MKASIDDDSEELIVPSLLDSEYSLEHPYNPSHDAQNLFNGIQEFSANFQYFFLI